MLLYQNLSTVLAQFFSDDKGGKRGKLGNNTKYEQSFTIGESGHQIRAHEI